MFFVSTQANYKNAVEAKREICRLNVDLNSREWYPLYVAYDNGDEVEIQEFDIPEEEFEKVAILEFDLEQINQLFLHNIVMTYTNSALTLEVHINRQAKTLLSKQEYKKFKRKSHRNKWEDLPGLLGKQGFDLNTSPFSDFVDLVKIRNGIVHYEDLPELWNYNDDESNQENLEKNLTNAKKSIDTTQHMIIKLAEFLGQGFPSILKERKPIYIV